MPKFTTTAVSAAGTLHRAGTPLARWIFTQAFRVGYCFGRILRQPTPPRAHCTGAFELVLDHRGNAVVGCPACDWNYFLPGGVTAEEVCLVLQTLNSTTHHV